MYYVYTSVQSVIHTYDRLGRRFRFVYFMLVLLCFCVAAVSRRIKIYIMELLGRMHQATHQEAAPAKNAPAYVSDLLSDGRYPCFGERKFHLF